MKSKILFVLSFVFASSSAFAAQGEMWGFPGNLKGCFIGGSAWASCYCNIEGNAPYTSNNAIGCTTCGPGNKCTYGNKTGGLKVVGPSKKNGEVKQ